MCASLRKLRSFGDNALGQRNQLHCTRETRQNVEMRRVREL